MNSSLPSEITGVSKGGAGAVAYIVSAGNGLESFIYREIDRLSEMGLDKYGDVPTDGDVVRIQDTFWEVITVDPEGFHMNDRRYPFDYQANIVPWQRSVTPKDENYEEFRRR